MSLLFFGQQGNGLLADGSYEVKWVMA